MKITRITVKAIFNQGPLLGVLDIVLDDCMVVKDIRVVECANKRIVAMPCRKATVRCVTCNCKNNAGANYCSDCGKAIPFQEIAEAKLYTDVVHPVTPAFRAQMTVEILEAFEKETASRRGPQPRMRAETAAASSQFLSSVDNSPDPGA
jgi:DNA-binding cell septation regulator SpoVG